MPIETKYGVLKKELPQGTDLFLVPSQIDSEPVAWLVEFLDANNQVSSFPFETEKWAQDFARSHGGTVRPLFLIPQPKEMVFPSVDELRQTMMNVTQKGDLTIDYAEAILELLKEKNK